MKDSFELEIGPDGIIRTIYQDGIEKFAEDLGGSVNSSCRASNVEWEDLGEGEDDKGWTVQSVFNPNLYIREVQVIDDQGFWTGDFELKCTDETRYDIHCFKTREQALRLEAKHFWELLAPQRKSNKDGK